MKILIIGGGGREHAMAWKLSRSKSISGLYVLPGNAGTADIAANVTGVDVASHADVVGTCRELGIGLVFVGPEEPLARGIVDDLRSAGIPAIGPGASAARLESSKAFAKSFMFRHGIPTAQYEEFDDYTMLESWLKRQSPGKFVIKKSGLAAGKGVVESDDSSVLLEAARGFLRDDVVVLEDHLSGYELSAFALCDGNSYKLLPAAMDFKKAYEDDQGPNTGGMGALCPVPFVDERLMQRIEAEIVRPTFKGMLLDGLSYKGVLFFGLMITENGPRVLEYNVRFGDPETQVLMPLLDCDGVELLTAIKEGRLHDFRLPITHRSALAVVLAAEGYPGPYESGHEVEIAACRDKDCLIFHAATRRTGDELLRTAGGRCLTVVGLGGDIFSARSKAYDAAALIRSPGLRMRSDIGKRFLTS